MTDCVFCEDDPKTKGTYADGRFFGVPVCNKHWFELLKRRQSAEENEEKSAILIKENAHRLSEEK